MGSRETGKPSQREHIVKCEQGDRVQGRKPRAAMSSAKAKQFLHKQLAPWLTQCLRAHSERPEVGNG